MQDLEAVSTINAVPKSKFASEIEKHLTVLFRLKRWLELLDRVEPAFLKGAVPLLIEARGRKVLLAERKTSRLQVRGQRMVLHLVVDPNVVGHDAWDSLLELPTIVLLENMTVSMMLGPNCYAVLEGPATHQVGGERAAIIWSNHVFVFEDRFVKLLHWEEFCLSLSHKTVLVLKINHF